MTPEHPSIFANQFPQDLTDIGPEIFSLPLFPVLLHIPAIAETLNNSELHIKELLHPQELDEYHSYSLEKRRKEFLTGRLCAKLAINNFLRYHNPEVPFLPLPEILLSNESSGRPLLLSKITTDEDLQGDISISHSGEYGCAVYASKYCGIDIQIQNRTLIKVKDRYCTEQEEILLCKIMGEQPDSQIALARLWAAKEACKKALSTDKMPGFLDMILTEAKPDTSQTMIMHFTIQNHSQKEIKILTTNFHNYGLALTLQR